MEKKYLQVYNKIKEYGTIIIHRHSRPDGDAIGSQIGLKEAIKRSFPYKKVYVVGDENEKFSFLGKMDQISDEVYKQALVFVLDSGDDFLVSDERFKLGKFTIRIDHHLFKGTWCDLEVLNSNEISCASMIADMIFKTKMKLSELGAQALFTGIVTDSGRFRYDGTSAKTFETVSKLYSYGFDANKVYNSIYLEDINVVKLRAQLTMKFKISDGGVAYLMNTQNDIKMYNTDIFTISRGMIGIMAGIKEIDVWANFTEDENGKILVELRSSKYNVNQVAVKYGGGGHKQASGATVESFEVCENIIKDLEKLSEE